MPCGIKIEEEEVEVPRDSKAVKLWEATGFDKPREVQRLFAEQLSMGYNSGLGGPATHDPWGAVKIGLCLGTHDEILLAMGA